MAVVPYTIEALPAGAQFPKGVRVIMWQHLVKHADVLDSGAPYIAPHYSDKSVQISGTKGVGGALLVEGSNAPEGTAPVYGTLNDGAGNPMTYVGADIDANNLDQVLEACSVIRPRLTGGENDVTDITVRLLIETPAR